jgi:hypothetical protein
MKTRYGFVSNSSSSSFIVGIGRIPEDMDRSQFIRMPYNADVMQGKEFIEHSNNKWSPIAIRAGMLEVNGGGNSGQDAWIAFDPEKDQEAWFYYININNDEGDDAFLVGDIDDYELDYDIDITWFPPEQRKAYEQLRALEDSQVYFGAERNG